MQKRSLVYSSITILVVSIAALLLINYMVKQNFKDENPKQSNQTTIEQNNEVNNPITVTGIVKHKIAECAPTPLQSKTCVFYNLIVLESDDNKTYSLYNLTSYNQLVNRQVEVKGFMTIPSKTNLPFISADLNVTSYSIMNNLSANTEVGSR